MITSPTGAAIYDILNVLTRRTRSVSVVLVPARVQGEFAGEEIAAAVELVNNFNRKLPEAEKIDVLIVGRGGGAAEDLWAFNEERVARAIYGSKIPVISAVGHETDLTIADMVADLRAPTPSAAAEMVAAHEAQMENFIFEKERNLAQLISWKISEAKNEVREPGAFLRLHAIPAEPERKAANGGKFPRPGRRFFARGLSQNGRRLENLTRRLSPIKLSAGVSENRGRLAALTKNTLPP